MEDQKPERLRPPAEPRFAGPLHAFDLEATDAQLQQQSRPNASGHRQETLYKHGLMSVSLFLFDPLSGLTKHRAKGVVTIHVLQGHLQITAEGRAHDLHAGHLLVLAPGVEHDLLAHAETRMLLTVCLEPNTPKTSP